MSEFIEGIVENARHSNFAKDRGGNAGTVNVHELTFVVDNAACQREQEGNPIHIANNDIVSMLVDSGNPADVRYYYNHTNKTRSLPVYGQYVMVAAVAAVALVVSFTHPNIVPRFTIRFGEIPISAVVGIRITLAAVTLSSVLIALHARKERKRLTDRIGADLSRYKPRQNAGTVQGSTADHH